MDLVLHTVIVVATNMMETILVLVIVVATK